MNSVNIGASGPTQVSAQWEEIQRVANERNTQRQNLLAKQYGTQQQSRPTQYSQELHEEQRSQRVVFTKNGKLQQNYIPKGTLFDRVG